METISTTEKISRLEKELAELREQERSEKEETARKAAEERGRELSDIMDSIKTFNEKHNEHITLAVKRPSALSDSIWHTFFPWVD